jgi:hypothetical protein
MYDSYLSSRDQVERIGGIAGFQNRVAGIERYLRMVSTSTQQHQHTAERERTSWQVENSSNSFGEAMWRKYMTCENISNILVAFEKP